MDSQKALAYTLELQRLRSIEAAARALGTQAPYQAGGPFGACSYCGIAGWKQGLAHDPKCPWQALQAALGQGQAGGRGGDE